MVELTEEEKIMESFDRLLHLTNDHINWLEKTGDRANTRVRFEEIRRSIISKQKELSDKYSGS